MPHTSDKPHPSTPHKTAMVGPGPSKASRTTRWPMGAGVGAAAVAVALGLFLTHGGAIGASSSAGAAARTATRRATFSESSAQARGVVDLYRLSSVTGGTVVFPNGRPTLLYFMSAWCSSCWQGDSQIAQIYPQLRHEAQVVSLDVTPQVDSPSQVVQMAQSTGATWPHAFATPEILTRYRVSSLDTAVVLSPRGKVLYDGPIPSNARLLALLREAARSGAA